MSEEEVNLIAILFEEARKYPLLSREEELVLGRQMRDGNEEEIKEARQRLIQSNLRLAISVAKQYQGRGDLTFLDLIQESMIGLMTAVDKYDPERGNRLSTVIVPWCRQAVSRAIACQGKTIRLPVQLGDDVRKCKAISSRLQKELGREPTNVELAVEMETHIEKIERLLQVGRFPVSLDEPRGKEGDVSLGDFVEDVESEDPLDIASQGLLREELDEILGSLSKRNEAIVRARFGLDGGEAKSLKQVGDEFGITRERVRQITLKFCRLARHPIRRRRLEGFLER